MSLLQASPATQRQKAEKERLRLVQIKKEQEEREQIERQKAEQEKLRLVQIQREKEQQLLR